MMKKMTEKLKEEQDIHKETEHMRDEEIGLLFRALSRILSNQDIIKKHMGLNMCDSEYGWNDEETMELSRECLNTAVNIEQNNNEY